MQFGKSVPDRLEVTKVWFGKPQQFGNRYRVRIIGSNCCFWIKSLYLIKICVLMNISLSIPVMQQSASEKERGRSGQFGKRNYA
jgi:hypothetical protein